MANICVFGASSTWGAWDLEKGGWVNRLRLWMDEQTVADGREEFEWMLYNMGVSGDKTTDVLERFDVEVRARQPKMIIFSIGDNDAAYENEPGNNRVVLDDFGKNIGELIKRSRKYTEKILFLGLKPVDETKTMPIPWSINVYYANEDIRRYDEKIQGVVQAQQGVQYLPINDLLGDGDLADGLHPNEKGHEKIYQKVKSWLEDEKWLGA